VVGLVVDDHGEKEGMRLLAMGRPCVEAPMVAKVENRGKVR